MDVNDKEEKVEIEAERKMVEEKNTRRNNKG